MLFHLHHCSIFQIPRSNKQYVVAWMFVAQVYKELVFLAGFQRISMSDRISPSTRPSIEEIIELTSVSEKGPVRGIHTA